MKLAECYRHLATLWRDELIVCALSSAGQEWWETTHNENCFYLEASMGLAPCLGMGLAMGLPQAKVWVFDGDGCICMNPGALLTEAARQPGNFVHFVISNHCYRAIDGHPLVNADQTDYAALARSMGVQRAFTFSDPDDFRNGIGPILADGQYAFVVLEVEKEPKRRGDPISIEGAELKYRFGRHIERQFGIQVFGPSGY